MEEYKGKTIEELSELLEDLQEQQEVLFDDLDDPDLKEAYDSNEAEIARIKSALGTTVGTFVGSTAEVEEDNTPQIERMNEQLDEMLGPKPTEFQRDEEIDTENLESSNFSDLQIDKSIFFGDGGKTKIGIMKKGGKISKELNLQGIITHSDNSSEILNLLKKYKIQINNSKPSGAKGYGVEYNHTNTDYYEYWFNTYDVKDVDGLFNELEEIIEDKDKDVDFLGYMGEVKNYNEAENYAKGGFLSRLFGGKPKKSETSKKLRRYNHTYIISDKKGKPIIKGDSSSGGATSRKEAHDKLKKSLQDNIDSGYYEDGDKIEIFTPKQYKESKYFKKGYAKGGEVDIMLTDDDLGYYSILHKGEFIEKDFQSKKEAENWARENNYTYAKGGEIREGEMVFVTSEDDLVAEVTNMGSDQATVEFLNRRPSGGDKRGAYPISDLVYAHYDWDKNTYTKTYAKGGDVIKNKDKFGNDGYKVFAVVDNFDYENQDYDQLYYKTDDEEEITDILEEYKKFGDYVEGMEVIEVMSDGRMIKYRTSIDYSDQVGKFAKGGENISSMAKHLRSFATPKNPKVDYEKVKKGDEIYREHNRERIKKGIEQFSEESSNLWIEKYDDRLKKLNLTLDEKSALNPKNWYAKGGTTDDVIMIEIGGDKKYPYYIKKIDTTHMSMANNKDGVDLVVPSNILQHKGESYYDDVRSWLKGGTSPNGKSYDSDYYAKGGKIEYYDDGEPKLDMMEKANMLKPLDDYGYYLKIGNIIHYYDNNKNWETSKIGYAKGGEINLPNGVFIDTRKTTQSKDEILEMYSNQGYTAIGGGSLLSDKFKRYNRDKDVYIVVGEIKHTTNNTLKGKIYMGKNEVAVQNFIPKNIDTKVITKIPNTDSSNYAKGGEIASAIFNSNSKKGKISTSFGDKTKEGLTAMIENDSYSAKEIANAIFEFNEKRDKVKTNYGDKTKEGLISMIESARDSYAKGGETAPSITNYRKNIMGTLSFDLKVKGMRKPQDFIVYPITEKTDKIRIQSDKKWGEIHINSGKGILSKSGSTSWHLHSDMMNMNVIKFELTPEELEELKTQIKSTSGKDVGNTIMRTDNSGAALLEHGGEIDLNDVSIYEADENGNFTVVIDGDVFDMNYHTMPNMSINMYAGSRSEYPSDISHWGKKITFEDAPQVIKDKIGKRIEEFHTHLDKGGKIKEDKRKWSHHMWFTNEKPGETYYYEDAVIDYLIDNPRTFKLDINRRALNKPGKLSEVYKDMGISTSSGYLNPQDIKQFAIDNDKYEWLKIEGDRGSDSRKRTIKKYLDRRKKYAEYGEGLSREELLEQIEMLNTMAWEEKDDEMRSEMLAEVNKMRTQL